MASLTQLDRDILALMIAGHDLSADHMLASTERYHIAGRCVSASAVRALQTRGFVRSMGEHDSCEGFEVTEVGRLILRRQ